MKIYLYFSFFLLLVSLMPEAFGQKYSNEFLSIGVGARARGMGNAAIAGTPSVMSGYWNPAAIGDIDLKGLQLGAMHTEQFAGVAKYDFLGLILPATSKDRVFGFSLIRFGIDDSKQIQI